MEQSNDPPNEQSNDPSSPQSSTATNPPSSTAKDKGQPWLLAEMWHGRYPQDLQCDSPPGYGDPGRERSGVRGFFWNLFFGRKEFENGWFPLDMFICIPTYLRYYETWEEHLKEKHKRFSTLSSPPYGVVNPQIVDGINVELLREHYKMQIELYEKYLDLLIRFNILNFGITGATLSFSLTYIDRSLLNWAFAVPCAMNFLFAILLLMAFRSLKIINREIIYMSEFLGFLPPGVRTLRHALSVSCMVLTLVVLVLLPTTLNQDLCLFEALNLNKPNSAAEVRAKTTATQNEGGAAAQEASPSPSPSPSQSPPSPSQSPETK